MLAQFERLGWAGLYDSRHDVGTDLYLRPRDSRRFELGVVLGAQVKTGSSFFDKPSHDESGKLVGWWYTESNREHFDYWFTHALPHILILRDQNTDASYYAHVSPEATISTGKGVKILVPCHQTVDMEHSDELTEIALTQRQMPTWDGSAWHGAKHMSEADRIRHALVAPRIVAPHPNSTITSLTGVEALALQVDLRDSIERILRRDELGALATHQKHEPPGLSLKEAFDSDDWRWNATAAIHVWLYNGDESQLSALKTVATTPEERAASAVLQCAPLWENGAPEGALNILDQILEYDDYRPIDYAWLQSHRAWALLEIGRQTEAFDLAMSTQRIYREQPNDLTAAAIAGACAYTAFSAAGWMRGDVGDVIRLNDHPVRWWRSQRDAQGLAEHLRNEYRAWSDPSSPSLVIGQTDSAHRPLRASSITALFAADHSGWRSAQSELARHLLVTTPRDADTETITGFLHMLRVAGDSKSLAAAVKRIVRDGPCRAVQDAASVVDLARSTRTTALADLELLICAGDVLDTEQAGELVEWALATFNDPARFCERTLPMFKVHYKLIDLLKQLVWTVDGVALDKICEFLLEMPPVENDALAQSLDRLVLCIPDTAWTPGQRRRAGVRAPADAPFLREAFLRVASPEDEQTLDAILRRARKGDLQVLQAIPDISSLPTDAAAALAAACERVINDKVDAAGQGKFGYGGTDYPHTLALINYWHPGQARWDSIVRFLECTYMMPDQQQDVLTFLGRKGSELNEGVKERLSGPVKKLRSRVFQPSFFGGATDIRHLAAEAEAALSAQSCRPEIVRELLGSQRNPDRAAAARILDRFPDPTAISTLLALAGDSAREVRIAGIQALSRLVAQGHSVPQQLKLLQDLLVHGGRAEGIAIVSRLLDCKTLNPSSAELLAAAESHPSARVRIESANALARYRGQGGTTSVQR